MGRYSAIRQLFRLPGLLIAPITYGLIKLAEKFPALTERVYSTAVYGAISQAVAKVSSVVPFSIAEFLIIFAVIAIVLTLVVRIIKCVFYKPGNLMRLISLFITYALSASWLFFLFYAMWGFNYYRIPLDKKLELPEGIYSAEQLSSVCELLAERAVQLRAQVSEDENGVFCIEGGFEEMAASIVEAYANYGEQNSLFARSAYPVKNITHSATLSNAGISGIFIGFTGEANVNSEQPYLYLPFAAAHETAHYFGWAHEGEANFAAFLVCYAADDCAVAYSGVMNALVLCGNSLSSIDSQAYSELLSTYSDGMRRDISDYSDYIKRHEDGRLNKLSERINDSYLKFNGQENGIQSYNEAVGLILRYFDSIGAI